MFKKFHWGHGIALFYIVFVGAVVTALVASFSVDHSLVVDDYYAQDLKYQSQFEKIQHGMAAPDVVLDQNVAEQILTISFADKEIIGSAFFYRPSDKSKDFRVPIKSNQTQVPTDNLLSGKWILKLEWEVGGHQYYKEEIVII